MPARIRVLESANRTMQRLGFLKLLCARVAKTDTSNLASIGKKLIDIVTSKYALPVPVSSDIRDYVRKRLTTKNYHDLRRQVLESKDVSGVRLELQDIYLADSQLPSRTGKLVSANWEKYPLLGISLCLVKKGTYSSLTRSMVLLAVTPEEELAAFSKLDLDHNPMLITATQAMLFLYCYVENDAEVLLPLFSKLLSFDGPDFDERDAGGMLADIFRQITKKHRSRGITAEERDQLGALEKTAASIDKWKGKSYTGGGAREENTRVRLETFCDLGFFTKPDKDRYRYAVSDTLRPFMQCWQECADSDEFLKSKFFGAVATSRGVATTIATVEQATIALVQAGRELQSTLGYSPIADLALLAGIKLLSKQNAVLELSTSIEFLKKLQKQHPTFVRFTVDRMGVLANVKFIGDLPEAEV